MLIGREVERAQLREIVDDARRGVGAAVVMRGEPGVGKSALLWELGDDVEGMRLIRVRGVESESRLAFAGLGDVLRPVLDRREALPPAQRVALEAALALGPPGVPDRFAAYAATLALMGAAAAEEPLLILIDDAHWLDTPSQEALLFCARRLGDDPIAVVATSRERPPEGFDLTAVRELWIGPLAEDDARGVLRARGGHLAPAVVDAILPVAGGNPLALIELARALSDDERAGRAPLPHALRPGEGLTRAFRDRIERLGPGGRRAALLAAISEDGDAAALGAALAGLGGGPDDVDAAEDAGVLWTAGGSVRMRHPAIRAVVMGLATARERREAHRALADHLDPHSAAEERAWHLSEAAIGPDEPAAAALDQAAAISAGRTGYAAASIALERAAAIGATEGRGPRRLAAAQMAVAAGDGRRATALLGDEDPAGGDAAGEAAHLRGILALFAGDPDGAFALLRRAGEARVATEPARAAAMLGDAALTRAMAGHCRQALEVARRAYDVGRPVLDQAPGVLGFLAGCLVLCGEARAARPFTDRFDAMVAELDPVSPGGAVLVATMSWRPWIGDHEYVAGLLDRWIERGRAAAAVGFLPFPLAFACEVETTLGRWDRARAHGAEAVALMRETGQLGLTGYALCNLARVEAGMGLADDAERRVREAIEAARAQRVGSVEVYGAAVLGFLALGEGDAASAAAALEPARDLANLAGLEEPAAVPWQPDLVEAYARLGRLTDARRELARLAERAHRTGGEWALAVTSRCRGLIDDDIDRHFGEALVRHARTSTPFERARTELLYGGRLRRAGRRTDARAQLERALETFEELGARPWARQAREEIAASGARLRPRRAGAESGDLSPRELQVALTVAEGATNREAAARLFLSEKTIERHLGNVYRKLGLRSRTELARRFAGGGADQAVRTPGDASVMSSESQ